MGENAGQFKVGNTANWRHGMRSQRPTQDHAGLALARRGKRFAGCYHQVGQFRRAVEKLVRERHGEIDLEHTAKIQSLCRLELACRSLEWDMLVASEALPGDVLRSHNSLIVQWSIQRDRLLREILDGDAGAGDLASELYGGQPAA